MSSEVGGTGLEPVTPSLSSPQSCYSPLAGVPSFWPVCRIFRTLLERRLRVLSAIVPPRQQPRRARQRSLYAHACKPDVCKVGSACRGGQWSATREDSPRAETFWISTSPPTARQMSSAVRSGQRRGGREPASARPRRSPGRVVAPRTEPKCFGRCRASSATCRSGASCGFARRARPRVASAS
jgi:hypothetical protein